MGSTLTDILLFGKAQSSDVNNGKFVIYRRNILRWSAISSILDVIVKGVAPLSLPDAIADSLSYVKAFGGTEQGLPSGYTQLEYIESNGTQYIDLGYKGNGNTKVEIKFKYHTATSASGSGRVFGSRNAAAVDAFAIGSASGTASTNSTVAFFFGNQSYLVTDKSLVLDEWLDVVFDKTTHSINGIDYGDPYNDETFETPQNLKLFGFDNNNTMGYGYVDIAYCKVWDNGVLVRDLVSAKNSSGVLGLYDRANNQFYDNDGTGDFVAGSAVVPTPDAPMDIVSNNGKLVVRDNELPVAYKRLKDIIFDGETYYITDVYLTGADTTSFTINTTEAARNVLGCYTGSGSGNNISFYLAIAGTGNYVRYKGSLYRPMINDEGLGQDYTLSITPTGTTGFDTNVTWTELEFTCPDKLYIGWLANATSPKFLGTFKGNITVSNRANFVPCERVSDGAIGYYDTYSKTFFENQGEGTPTTSGYDYTHNTVVADGTVETIEDTIGNTATTEILLKVGDYTDVQSILDGVVTRNVGVKVLDGTEDWVKTTSYANAFRVDNFINSASSFVNLSTHFTPSSASTVGDAGTVTTASNNGRLILGVSTSLATTAEQFKQYLADQYAAGTPVIVIYPLATATTESVTGQTLQVTDGDNTLEITQASMTGLELEAQYQAAVSLTIQEVQDANLDPNVEVTIN